MSINCPPQNWRERFWKFIYGPAFRDYLAWKEQQRRERKP